MNTQIHTPDHVNHVRSAMNTWLTYSQQTSPPTIQQWREFENRCKSYFTAPWIINPYSTLCRYVTIFEPITTHIADPTQRGMGLLNEIQIALFNGDVQMFDELFHTAINYTLPTH